MHHAAKHCNTLQHTATHCNTLQHAATHYNTLQYTATHCNTLQHTAPARKECQTHQDQSQQLGSALRTRVHQLLSATALCCSVLQRVVVCGIVWQCVAMCCSKSALRTRVLEPMSATAACCSVLQCVTVCYSVLQCVAVCCSVLQCVSVVVVCCRVLQWVRASYTRAPTAVFNDLRCTHWNTVT